MNKTTSCWQRLEKSTTSEMLYEFHYNKFRICPISWQKLHRLHLKLKVSNCMSFFSFLVNYLCKTQLLYRYFTHLFSKRTLLWRMFKCFCVPQLNPTTARNRTVETSLLNFTALKIYQSKFICRECYNYGKYDVEMTTKWHAGLADISESMMAVVRPHPVKFFIPLWKRSESFLFYLKRSSTWVHSKGSKKA